MTRPPNAPSYEDDFVAWLEDQARRARRGEADELDLENIAEELEGMARSDRRKIRNRLIVFGVPVESARASIDAPLPTGRIKFIEDRRTKVRAERGE
jgi:hypothetical protein